MEEHDGMEQEEDMEEKHSHAYLKVVEKEEILENQELEEEEQGTVCLDLII
jgi:hypothetical protein